MGNHSSSIKDRKSSTYFFSFFPVYHSLHQTNEYTQPYMTVHEYKNVYVYVYVMYMANKPLPSCTAMHNHT